MNASPSVSPRRVLGLIGRAIMWTGLVLGVLFALGFLYLILFPPFRIPATGAVKSETHREVTLRPGSPVATMLLDVRHDDRLFENGSSYVFPATRLEISSTLVEGGQVPFELRLYPGFATPISGLAPSADRHSTALSVDCGGVACTRTYLVVLSAEGLTSEVKASVDVAARLRMPAHVEVPFLASIGLDLRELRMTDGVALQTNAVSGTASVSASGPAVWQPISIPGAQAESIDGRPIAGVSLEVDATRVGDMVPVGIRSPPPVRVALVRVGTGEIVVEVDVPAGVTTAVALPPIEGDYRLVVLWQDRAAQAYDVHWRLERGALASAPGVSMATAPAVQAPTDSEMTASGETAVVVNAGRPNLDFGVGIELGNGGPNFLPPVVGVVGFDLELVGDLHDPPVTALLVPDRSLVREEASVTLVPGQRVHLTFDALVDCPYRCTPWHLEIPAPPDGGLTPGETVTIRWRAAFELWDLDPDPATTGPYLYRLEPQST